MTAGFNVGINHVGNPWWLASKMGNTWNVIVSGSEDFCKGYLKCLEHHPYEGKYVKVYEIFEAAKYLPKDRLANAVKAGPKKHK